MTKDEVIALAVKTGLIRVGDGWTEPHRWGLSELEGFAKLVAAFAAAAEREACAKVVQDHPFWLGNKAKEEITAAIRARGNHD